MPRSAVSTRFNIRDQHAAIAFDGSTSFLVKASPTGINNGTNGSVTVSAWVRLDKSDLCTVAEMHVNGGTSPSFGVGQSGGQYVVFSDRVNGGNNKVIAKATFDTYIGLNRWVMLTYVLTSANITIYAGTTAILPTSSFGTAINAGTISNLFIGKGQTVGQADIQFLKGGVKDVRIYNAALTATEVSNLYYSQIDSTTPSAAWQMDEGAGASIVTSVGSNNLTATGITWTADRPFAARKRSVNANMVRNGNFEYAPPFTAATTTNDTVIDGTASGGSKTGQALYLFKWKLNAFVTTSPSAQYDSVDKNSGLYSLKLSGTDIKDRVNCTLAERIFTDLNDPNDIANHCIRVTPNTAYLMSFAMKTSFSGQVGSPVGGRLRVLQHTNTAYVTVNSSTTVSTTTGWTNYTVPFVTSSTTTYLNIEIGVFGDASNYLTGTVWFDDISLTPVYPEGRVPANGNLVKNFDFEVVPTLVAPMTTAARWIDGSAAGSATNSTYKYAVPSGSFGGGGSANFDSTVSRTGSSSLKLSTNAVGGSVSVTQYVTLSEGIALGTVYRLNPLTSYTLTGWIKTNNAAAGSVTLSCRELNAATSTVVTNTSSSVDGTADWTQVTVTFTTAASTVYGALILRNNVTGNVSDAWFDDIYLAPTTNPGRIAIT